MSGWLSVPYIPFLSSFIRLPFISTVYHCLLPTSREQNGASKEEAHGGECLALRTGLHWSSDPSALTARRVSGQQRRVLGCYELELTPQLPEDSGRDIEESVKWPLNQQVNSGDSSYVT